MSDSAQPISVQVTEATGSVQVVNELFDAASVALIFGRNAQTSTGLTFGFFGGPWGPALVPAATLALTASSVNYVVVERSTGVVSVAVANTNWNNTADFARAWLITAGPSTVTYEDYRMRNNGTHASGAGGGGTPAPKVIPIAVSDETTALTAGTAKVTFRMPFAMTLSAIRASLTAAQASGSIFTVDVNENGSTILSTKLTVDNTEKTSTTAATPAVISDTALADDAEITIDIDQIGDGSAAGLKVYLIGT